MSAGTDPPRRGIGRIAELGPAWIGAIAALISALTTAGFFAGRVTAPAASGPPKPTITPTAPSTSVSTGSDSSGQGSTSPNGTQLGSYSIELPMDLGVLIGPMKPTQSQFSKSGVGDIEQDYYDVSALNGDKMLSLAGGTTPTYRMCTADTLYENQTSGITPGTAFCLVETAGRMAGVTVSSVSSTQPFYIVLNVTIWQNS
jgi:hypothetical protein